MSLTSASNEPEDPGSSTSHGPLTDRQELVAQMVARGETCASIAEQLQVPVRAVEGHVYRILEALDVASMTELTKETIDQYQARLDPPIEPIESEYLTVGEIALNMRVSKMTVYRLIQSGVLKSVRFGRSYRITQTALQHYLDTLNSSASTVDTIDR